MKGFGENTASYSYRKLFRVVVSNCWNIPEGRYMSDVQHRAMVSRPYFKGQCLAGCKSFGSIEGGTRGDMARSSRPNENMPEYYD